MGLMQALLNLYRRGTTVSVAVTRFFAHAQNMLVPVDANACHGLMFQTHPLWVLQLAFPMLCALQNGKIRPKQSSSGKVNAVLAQRS